MVVGVAFTVNAHTRFGELATCWCIQRTTVEFISPARTWFGKPTKDQGCNGNLFFRILLEILYESLICHFKYIHIFDALFITW